MTTEYRRARRAIVAGVVSLAIGNADLARAEQRCLIYPMKPASPPNLCPAANPAEVVRLDHTEPEHPHLPDMRVLRISAYTTSAAPLRAPSISATLAVGNLQGT
jgi:hypothetical protein